MRIKMLREVNGKIETFYVDSLEEKKLYDTRRKKYRQLGRPLDTRDRKTSLRKRQKAAKELRDIKMKLNDL